MAHDQARLKPIELLLAGLLLASAGCELKVDGDDQDPDSKTEDITTDGTTIGSPDLSGRRKDDGPATAGMGGGDGDGSMGDGDGMGPAVGDGDGPVAGDGDGPAGPTDSAYEATQGPAPDGCDMSLLASATMFDDLETKLMWSGVVHLPQGFSNSTDEAIVMVAPGTTVFVGQDKEIRVGELWTGGIQVMGTDAEPVRFCPASQSWKGLWIGDRSLSSSKLEHLLIAGAGGGSAPAALEIRGPVTIDHVWVQGSLGLGVRANDFGLGSRALTVTGSAKAPLTLTHTAVFEHLPTGGDFTGNGSDVVRLSFSGNQGPEIHLQPLGVPYLIEENIAIGDVALKIDAGVTVQVALDRSIELGWAGGKADVQMLGTADAPIRFRGATEEPGSWRGILIKESARSTSKLEHVEIAHAGGGDWTALQVKSPVTLIDVSLVDNATRAFSIGAQGLSMASTPLTVRGTRGVAGWLTGNAIVTFPGATLSDNQEGFIEYAGGNISTSGTVRALSVPYRMTDDVAVTSALAIEPGVVFEMLGDLAWTIAWAGSDASVDFVGTADAPIVFRGVAAEPGYWRGMQVEYKTASSSKLSYVEIRDAGGPTSSAAALELDVPIEVSQCTFANSSGYGMQVGADYPNDYEGLNTFEGNATGTVQRR